MAQTHTPAQLNLIGSRRAAELLGLDRDHFNRLVRAGTIPAVGKMDGVTGARLFDPAVIEGVRRQREQEQQDLAQ